MPAIPEDVALIISLEPRFFEGLTATEVTSILVPATKRRFMAQEVVTHEGHTADRMFLVIRGRARQFCTTPQGKIIPLKWIPPGEIFGGVAFLSRQLEYLASTEAVNETTALEWDRATIRSLAAQFPRLMENALLVAHDYFVLYRSLIISATCQTARQRLARVLGNLATGLGKRVADGFELNIRNEELANEANITIFTVSRLLNEWQREGILTKSHGRLVLRSREALLLREG